MLSLPQAASARTVDAVSGRPLLHVQEDSTVWVHLAPLIYVSRAPEPALDASQLDLIRAILDAARKYNLLSVTECMRRVLKSPDIVAAKPVSVYALACVHGLEDVARVGARQSLSEPLGTDYVEELDLISVRTFHKLTTYRSKCVAAALKAVSAWYKEGSSDKLSVPKNCNYCKRVERDGRTTRGSWAIYMERLERSLEQTPHATKARSTSLLWSVTTSLEREVKEAIDKVALEF
ncbi:hypothetical protein GSI_09381 [Ganoderma sinense ZZ0214-1]|uniref:BTB domain-containing protein n=1 Tax=Ganoderma sinense ZZ0214-1 TaxID=1077348 RepID=A0A2G8S6C6_9APHY|nr:hypothetical protein GSI_09381 [Ganoderma sinense ZZ0214-1]